MSPLRLAGAALLIAGLPATLFALFGMAGLLDGGSALVGAGLSLGAGAVLGGLWLTSLDRLALALRRASEDDGATTEPPPLPAAAEVAGEVGRLARALQRRSEEVGRMRRADAAILDPTDSAVAPTMRAADALLGSDEYCGEYIKAFRAGKLS